MEDNVKDLYNALISDGYYTENELGGEDGFCSVVSNPENAKGFYQALMQDGRYNEKNFVSEGDFMKFLGHKQKPIVTVTRENDQKPVQNVTAAQGTPQVGVKQPTAAVKPAQQAVSASPAVTTQEPAEQQGKPVYQVKYVDGSIKEFETEEEAKAAMNANKAEIEKQRAEEQKQKAAQKYQSLNGINLGSVDATSRMGGNFSGNGLGFDTKINGKSVSDAPRFDLVETYKNARKRQEDAEAEKRKKDSETHDWFNPAVVEEQRKKLQGAVEDFNNSKYIEEAEKARMEEPFRTKAEEDEWFTNKYNELKNSGRFANKQELDDYMVSHHGTLLNEYFNELRSLKRKSRKEWQEEWLQYVLGNTADETQGASGLAYNINKRIDEALNADIPDDVLAEMKARNATSDEYLLAKIKYQNENRDPDKIMEDILRKANEEIKLLYTDKGNISGGSIDKIVRMSEKLDMPLEDCFQLVADKIISLAETTVHDRLVAAAMPASKLEVALQDLGGVFVEIMKNAFTSRYDEIRAEALEKAHDAEWMNDKRELTSGDMGIEVVVNGKRMSMGDYKSSLEKQGKVLTNKDYLTHVNDGTSASHGVANSTHLVLDAPAWMNMGEGKHFIDIDVERTLGGALGIALDAPLFGIGGKVAEVTLGRFLTDYFIKSFVKDGLTKSAIEGAEKALLEGATTANNRAILARMLPKWKQRAIAAFSSAETFGIYGAISYAAPSLINGTFDSDELYASVGGSMFDGFLLGGVGAMTRVPESVVGRKKALGLAKSFLAENAVFTSTGIARELGANWDKYHTEDEINWGDLSGLLCEKLADSTMTLVVLKSTNKNTYKTLGDNIYTLLGKKGTTSTMRTPIDSMLDQAQIKQLEGNENVTQLVNAAYELSTATDATKDAASRKVKEAYVKVMRDTTLDRKTRQIVALMCGGSIPTSIAPVMYAVAEGNTVVERDATGEIVTRRTFKNAEEAQAAADERDMEVGIPSLTKEEYAAARQAMVAEEGEKPELIDNAYKAFIREGNKINPTQRERLKNLWYYAKSSRGIINKALADDPMTPVAGSVILIGDAGSNSDVNGNWMVKGMVDGTDGNQYVALQRRVPRKDANGNKVRNERGVAQFDIYNYTISQTKFREYRMEELARKEVASEVEAIKNDPAKIAEVDMRVDNAARTLFGLMPAEGDWRTIAQDKTATEEQRAAALAYGKALMLRDGATEAHVKEAGDQFAEVATSVWQPFSFVGIDGMNDRGTKNKIIQVKTVDGKEAYIIEGNLMEEAGPNGTKLRGMVHLADEDGNIITDVHNGVVAPRAYDASTLEVTAYNTVENIANGARVQGAEAARANIEAARVPEVKVGDVIDYETYGNKATVKSIVDEVGKDGVPTGKRTVVLDVAGTEKKEDISTVQSWIKSARQVEYDSDHEMDVKRDAYEAAKTELEKYRLQRGQVINLRDEIGEDLFTIDRFDGKTVQAHDRYGHTLILNVEEYKKRFDNASSQPEFIRFREDDSIKDENGNVDYDNLTPEQVYDHYEFQRKGKAEEIADLYVRQQRLAEQIISKQLDEVEKSEPASDKIDDVEAFLDEKASKTKELQDKLDHIKKVRKFWEGVLNEPARRNANKILDGGKVLGEAKAGVNDRTGMDVKSIAPEFVQQCDEIGKQLGLEIVFNPPMEQNGMWSASDPNRVYVGIDAFDVAPSKIAETRDRVMRAVFAHELNHKMSNEVSGHKEYINKHIKAYYQARGEWDSMSQNVRRLYAEEIAKAYDKAVNGGYSGSLEDFADNYVAEEIAGDKFGEVILEEDFLNKLMGKDTYVPEDLSFVGKVKNGISNLWDTVKKKLPWTEAYHLEKMKNQWLAAYNTLRAKAGTFTGDIEEDGNKSILGRMGEGLSIFADNVKYTLEQKLANKQADIAIETMPEEESNALSHIVVDDAAVEGLVPASDDTAKHSLKANFEGAGFEASIEVDGERIPLTNENGDMMIRMGERTFDYLHPVTSDDLKSAPNSILNYMVADARKYTGITEDKINNIYDNYANMLNYFLKEGASVNGGAANLTNKWQWMGEEVFRTVASNGDKQYIKSIDITRICKKNEAVINTISELQNRVGYGITPAQILDIYDQTIVEGYQAPCPVCYVFTRYIRNGKIASAAINGMRKYGKHLRGQAEEWTVDQWLAELERLGREKKLYAKDLERANKLVTEALDEIDVLAKRITNPNTPQAEKDALRQRVQELDTQYRKALDVVSQESLTNWIKYFAIESKNSKWRVRTDAVLPKDMDDFIEHALDLRKTASGMVKYPAIQRLRKSRGSAGGKEITQASNNELGSIPSGLGANKPEEAKNYYLIAQKAKSETVRKRALNSASGAFKKAALYARQQTLRGGQRMWSWSDNIERLANDVAVNLVQMELLNGAMQTYSKQLEGINMVARLGAYVNGSLMGKGLGYREVKPSDVEVVNGKRVLKDDGYEVTRKDGSKVVLRSQVHEMDGKLYVLEFDNVVGVDPYGTVKADGTRTKGLFDLNQSLDKAGNILVGMNDIHCKTAMADDRIYFIIPWHASGANNHVLAQMYQYLGVRFDTTDALDYTEMQEDKDMCKMTDGKRPLVNERLYNIWETHKNETDFPCGLRGGVESGRGQVSDSQLYYRMLRDAILRGVKIDGDNGKTKYQHIDEHPRLLKEVMADEFLSQVYRKVNEFVGKEGMTNEDCNHVYPYEYWDENSTFDTADVNGARYLEYCRRLGYKPKFCGKLDATDPVDANKGNFIDDRGYWKTLIDRRMYDTDGKFQDLTSIDTSNFDVRTIDPTETAKEFVVTKVADDAGVIRIADGVMRKEVARTGSLAGVNYDLDMPEAVRRFNDATAPTTEGIKFSKKDMRIKEAPFAEKKVLIDEEYSEQQDVLRNMLANERMPEAKAAAANIIEEEHNKFNADKKARIDNDLQTDAILNDLEDRLSRANKAKGELFRIPKEQHTEDVTAKIESLKNEIKLLKEEIGARKKEINNKYKNDNFNLDAAKDKADLAIKPWFDTKMQAVSHVPEEHEAVLEYLKNKLGWNGESTDVYIDASRFLSHWAAHHPLMTPEEYLYDMRLTFIDPDKVIISSKTGSVIYIRKGNNGMTYKNIINVEDGKLLYKTSFYNIRANAYQNDESIFEKGNPYKTMTASTPQGKSPTVTSVDPVQIIASAKVQQNSETAKGFTENSSVNSENLTFNTEKLSKKVKEELIAGDKMVRRIIEVPSTDKLPKGKLSGRGEVLMEIYSNPWLAKVRRSIDEQTKTMGGIIGDATAAAYDGDNGNVNKGYAYVVGEVMKENLEKYRNALNAAYYFYGKQTDARRAVYDEKIAEVDKAINFYERFGAGLQADHDAEGIRWSKKVQNADPFYSNAAKAVEGIKQEKATPEQWLAMIQKAGGLKAGEDKWMGLSEWLNRKKALAATGLGAADEKVKDDIRRNIEHWMNGGENITDSRAYAINMMYDYPESAKGWTPELIEEVANEISTGVRKDRSSKIITKQELEQFIAENSIKVEEVHYSDKVPEYPSDIIVPDDVRSDLLDKALDATLMQYGISSDVIWIDGRDIYADAENYDEIARIYSEKFGKKYDAEDPYDAEYLAYECLRRMEADYDANSMDFINDWQEDEYKRLKQNENSINDTRLTYTTEGLTDKREIALTVPTIDPWQASDTVHFGDAGNGRTVAWLRFGDAISHGKTVTERQADYDNYVESLVGKYGEEAKTDPRDVCTPEEIAELNRLWNEVSKPSTTERVLVIDEIQSNRHQEGRKRGYGDVNIDRIVRDAEDKFREYSLSMGERIKNGELTPEQAAQDLEDLKDEISKLKAKRRSGVPDAPFDKNWHELAMKRALRYAAENGYDKVAWTTGTQQAQRYDIGNVIYGADRYNDKYYLRMHEGDDIAFTLDNGRMQVENDEYGLNGKLLSDVVGKELATKIESLESAESITSDEISVGGEGMKAFYDKMLPSFMGKYGKKWGAKVGEVELDLPREADRKMWSVDVTPEMKESVMQGQAMFSKKDIRTDSFKNWFGDWEKNPKSASKVVDENGKPLVVYHGSPWGGFTVFDNSRGAVYDGLTWVTPDKSYAEIYADFDDPDRMDNEFYNPQIYELYANIKNPLELGNIEDDVDSETGIALARKLGHNSIWELADYLDYEPTHFGEYSLYEITRTKAFKEKIASLGYDGVIATEGTTNSAISFGAVEPTQIKSATDNNGNYDPTNPDIRYSKKDGRKAYGAPYQASKNKIAKDIIDVLPEGERFVDLFSGGGAMTHAAIESGKYGTYHMNDKFPIGQNLFLHGVEGKYNDYNRKVTKDEFDKMRYTEEAILHSQNGNGRSYAYDKNGRSKAEEQIRRVKNLYSLNGYRDRISSSEDDYKNVEIRKGDVLYADIPYDGTDNQAYKAGGFNHQEFFDWAKAQDVPVYISIGQNIAKGGAKVPEGFTTVWQKDVNNGGRITDERLIVADKFTGGDGTRFSIKGIVGAQNMDDADGGNRIANLSIAEDMLREGATALKIKKATGWEIGVDGKWRYEDVDGKFTDKLPEFMSFRSKFDYMKMGDIWDDPELYKAYPELKDMKVYSMGNRPDAEGAFGGTFFDINTKAKPDEMRKTFVHEIQHFIQRKEGFARGGNSRIVIPELQKLYEKQNDDAKKTAIRIDKMMPFYDGFSQYTSMGSFEHEMNWIKTSIEGIEKFMEMYDRYPEFFEGLTDRDLKAMASSYDTNALNNRLDKLYNIGYYGNHELKSMIRDCFDGNDYRFTSAPASKESAENMLAVARKGLDVAERFWNKVHKEWGKYGFERPAVEGAIGFKGYERLAGETESRNVETRLDMTPAQRRNSLLSKTEDVNRKNQIVRRVDADGNNVFAYAQQKVAERKAFNDMTPEEKEDYTSMVSYSKKDRNSADLTDYERQVMDEMDRGETIKVYRAMQVIDGKLYPPMAASVGGKLVEGAVPNDFLVADEHPELIKIIDGKPKFVLDKGGKDATGKKATSVPARYNPYWHTSNSMLNDQFKSAWIRPNMVVVECEIPKSELTSGYKAQYAKDAVGMVPWKSGSVTGELVKQGHAGREVYLSRYCKIGRVVPEDEVAQNIKEFMGGRDVEIPVNVVTPKLRAELEKAGVRIGAPENGVKLSDQIQEAMDRGLSVDTSIQTEMAETKYAKKVNRDPRSIEEYVAMNWIAPNPESIERELGYRSADRYDFRNFTRKNGQSMRRVSEMIYDGIYGTPWGEMYTDQDVFNIMSDILASGGPVKYLKGIYEREDADERAYEEEAQARWEAERDDWYYDNYGMTYGEYLDYQRGRSQRPVNNYIVSDKAVQAAQKKLTTQIAALLRDEYLSTADKREVNRLASMVRFATPENLPRLLDEANITMLDMRQKAQARQLAKILQMKTQDVNGRNMSVAKNVDDDTRQVFNLIRGNIRQMAENETQLAIEDVNKKISSIRKEINRMRVMLDRDEMTDAERDDMKARLEQAESQYESLWDERKKLRSQLDFTRSVVADTTITDVEGRIYELNEKLSNSIDGNEEFTRNDMIALTAYQALLKKLEVDAADTQINSVSRAIESAIQSGASQERINTLRHELLAAKQERAERQEQFIQTLNDLMEQGKNNLLERTEREVQRKRELVNGIFDDIRSDKKLTDATVGDASTSGFMRKWFLGPLDSFVHLADAINVNGMSKDGWFYKHFISGKNGVNEAYSTYLRNKQEGEAVLDAKAKELFGKGHAAVLAEQGKQIQKTGIHLYEDNGDGGWIDKGEFPCSKATATYYYQVWKMPDGRATLEKMGFNEKSMAQIKEFIGEKNIAWADWIQDEFLPERRERYNEKYREIYGTSMANIENYVPIRRSRLNIKNDENLNEFTQAVAKNVNEKVGSLINRTFNTMDLDRTANAFEVVTKHLNDMEEFYAYADVRRDLSDILSSKAVENQLNANRSGLYRALLENAKGATMVATPDNKANEVDKMFNKATKGIVGANIAFRLGTAIKQTESLITLLGYSADPRYLGRLLGYAVKDYVTDLAGISRGIFGKKAVLENTLNGKGMRLNADFRWCLENIPSFRQRMFGDQVDMATLDVSFADGSGKKMAKVGRAMDKAMSVGMFANQMIDGVTCAIAIKSIYDYKMARVKENIAEAMQTRRAEFNAEMEQKIATLKRNLLQFGNENAEGVKSEADIRKEYAEKIKQEEQQMWDEAKRTAMMDADIFYNSTQQSSHPAFTSDMQKSTRFLEKALTAYQNSPISFLRKNVIALQDLSKAAHFNRQVNFYESQYVAQGMSSEEAHSKARNHVYFKLASAASTLMMFTLANVGWMAMGQGLFGFLQSDEQKENLINPTNYPYYVANGTAGFNLLNNVLNWKSSSPFLFYEEIKNIMEQVKRKENKYGLWSPEVGWFLAGKLSRYAGVDAKTMSNIFLFAEHRIQQGATLDQMLMDVEYLISLSDSNRMSTIREFYKDKDMTFEDYVELVLSAGKIYQDDDWHRFLPNAKVLDDKQATKMFKELEEEYYTAHGNTFFTDEKKRKEELDQISDNNELLKMYNATENLQYRREYIKKVTDKAVLEKMFDATHDMKEREAIKNRIKSLKEAEEAAKENAKYVKKVQNNTDNPQLQKYLANEAKDADERDKILKRTDQANHAEVVADEKLKEKKPLDRGKAVVGTFETMADIEQAKAVDKHINSFDPKDTKEYKNLKTKQERKLYKAKHAKEFEKYDKMYKLRSGDNYAKGKAFWKSINDYIKAIGDGEISQEEGMKKIREIREEILKMQ